METDSIVGMTERDCRIAATLTADSDAKSRKYRVGVYAQDARYEQESDEIDSFYGKTSVRGSLKQP